MSGAINEHSAALANEWRRLTRAATGVALLTAPAFFVILYDSNHLSLVVALLVTAIAVVMFRGLVEVRGAQADPVAEPVRGRREPQAGGHRRPPALLVLARQVPPAAVLHPHHPGAARALPGAVRVRRRERAVLPSIRWTASDLPARHAAAAGAGVHPAAAAVLRQLRDLLRAVPVLRRAPDPRLRARRRELGREDRRRPRPGRGQGGDHPRDHPLAVRRGVREGRRQARARAAVPRRAGHRQDDDLEGDRDQLQLPVRDDPRFGLRRDVHRHGRDHGPVPGPQGAQAGVQVGRPVHRLHRRDRRRRDAPPGARRRLRSHRRRADVDPRSLLLRPERLADLERRPRDRVARVARAAVQPAGRVRRHRLRDLRRSGRPSASSACTRASGWAAGWAAWRSTSCWW